MGYIGLLTSHVRSFFLHKCALVFPCELLFYPKDGGSKFFRNISTFLPEYGLHGLIYQKGVRSITTSHLTSLITYFAV